MENKLNLEQFKHFLEIFYQSLLINPTWRLGQTAFNSLYMMDMEAGNYIRGTDLDPFYKDERIGATIKAIFSQEACESVEGIKFFNFIFTKLLEKELSEQVDLAIFSTGHSIEVTKGPDHQFQCYIDYPTYQSPFAIGLDFYSALLEGISKFLKLKSYQNEAQADYQSI